MVSPSRPTATSSQADLAHYPGPPPEFGHLEWLRMVWAVSETVTYARWLTRLPRHVAAERILKA